ncbi:hypothetical protein WR25_01501 [Diploscapter pachys]|uniref:Uncharacterized protein n=1 Tax=Diploscapter pachys TaxID=2018661 RepID=A0A2A2K1H5_9BILA|nr:hypothetical protein WR25_01501 [Diploscapter pachys]
MIGNPMGLPANCLNRIDGPLETTTTNVLATIQKSNPLAAESLTNSLHQSGLETDSAAADMRVQALFLRNLHEESINLRTSSAMGMGSILRYKYPAY